MSAGFDEVQRPAIGDVVRAEFSDKRWHNGIINYLGYDECGNYVLVDFRHTGDVAIGLDDLRRHRDGKWRSHGALIPRGLS